jgi:hypothetical protein
MSAKNNLSQINWEEYFANKSERNKATYVITPDCKSHYLYEGMILREKDFEMMVPVEIIKTNPKGNNADTTHIK